jgi:hypothetical protein
MDFRNDDGTATVAERHAGHHSQPPRDYLPRPTSYPSELTYIDANAVRSDATLNHNNRIRRSHAAG